MKHFSGSQISFQGALKLATAALFVSQLTMAEKSVNAQVTFSLDNLSPTFMAPATGTATYYIDGHVSATFGSINSYSWSFAAENFTNDVLTTLPASEFQHWRNSLTDIGDFSGHMISVTVAANQTPGAYYHDGIPSESPYFSIGYRDALDNFHTIQDNYEINIIPYSPPTSSTPEPGPVALLAGMSLTGCYWLKMRRNRLK